QTNGNVPCGEPPSTRPVSSMNCFCIGPAAVRAYPLARLHALNDFLDQLCFRAAFAAVDVTLQAEGAQAGAVAVNLGVLLAELNEPDGVTHRRHLQGMLASVAGAPLPSTVFGASHAARCVACHGVRSHPVPVALVGEHGAPGEADSRSEELAALVEHALLD